MWRITFILLLGLASAGCREPEPTTQAKSPPVHRVRDGGADSTTRPAEPMPDFLRELAEHSGSTTHPAGDMDELMRRLAAVCGNTGRATGKVITLRDESHSMQLRDSSTQPAESRLSRIRRLIERGGGSMTVFSRQSTTLPAGDYGESIRRIFDSYDDIDRVIIFSDGSASEYLRRSTTRPVGEAGDTPKP